MRTLSWFIVARDGKVAHNEIYPTWAHLRKWWSKDSVGSLREPDGIEGFVRHMGEWYRKERDW